MNEKQFLPAIKPHHAGCLCCEGLGETLDMNQPLWQGFGGWHIVKDGDIYYMADQHAEFEECKLLSDIESEALESPDSDWRAVCFTPLHGETYQRQNAKWLLVEQNEGFA